MTPELLAIRQAIEDQITTNHNGEITGAILNPILVGMVTALVDSIGDIEQLDTVDKENTVRAINELNALIQDLEPIQKFTGTDDPNDNPPTGAKLGDLYFQMDGGAVIDVWQFIEIRWVSLDTSSFVKKTGENLVSSDFSLKNGDTELYFDGEYFNIKVLDLHLYTFREDGLTYNDGNGNNIKLNVGGVSGNNNGVLWNVRKHTDDVENSLLTLPQSSTEQRLAISVNNQFADEFGNIEIEATDANALKKNESNVVTEDFEIVSGDLTVSIDENYALRVSNNADDSVIQIGSDEGFAFQYSRGSESLIFTPNQLGGYQGNHWSIGKSTEDTEGSNTLLPQTGSTSRRLALSVNNEFADENGNIELDYISEAEKGQPLGVATLDADGQIPTDQLPTKAMTIEGDWDASTNTPFLEDGVGNDGMVYVCQVAGTVDFGSGEYEFKVGDWAVYGANGKWFRNRNSNEVTSVNGKRGDVVLNAGDVGALADDDSRIDDWDSAYTFANGLGVPYTGANKPIDFGTQDFLHNGRLVQGSRFVKSGTLNLGSSANTNQTFYLNITDLSAGNKGFSVQVELSSLRAYRLVKSIDLYMSLSSSSIIVRQSAYTYATPDSDIAIGEPERISDTEIRIPIIPLQNGTTAVVQATILGRFGDYSNVKFSTSTESVTSTAPQPAPMFAFDATLQEVTDNGNTTTKDVVLEKSMLIFEATEEMSTTADSSNGWFWYGAGAKDDTPFYWNFRMGGGNETVNSFYFQDNDHQIITFPFQESDGSAVVAYQEWVNNKRKIYELDALVLNGAFSEELFDVCPSFDPNFVSWDLTWQDGDEYLSLKQEYFTKTDTPLRLTTVGGCLAITGDCFIQIDIPAGANLVLNYA